MTRTDKIRKLVNAIKEWKGSKNPDGSAFIRHAKPSALPRVIAWVNRLGLPEKETMEKIADFTHEQQFLKWIKSLETPVTSSSSSVETAD